MTGSPVDLLTWAGVAALLAWLWLLSFRGGFWRQSETLAGSPPAPDGWPSVTAIVPARNEADVLPVSLRSLLSQDYPGRLHVILVDDHSTDGTGDAARTAGTASGYAHRLTIVSAAARASGWVGKVHAMQQGLLAMPETPGRSPDFLLFTDADIAHPADGLRRLVAQAGTDRFDMVSLMVRLHCQSLWERLLIPAFVFFFAKLYPFRWAADPRRKTAAAAGGCMLLRRRFLDGLDGLAPIRDALIDDCALATLVKSRGGRLWLGLSDDAISLRPYRGLGEIWDMVARSAFTQLRHSTLLLTGTLLGMILLYLLPPLLALSLPLHGNSVAALSGACAWLLMAVSYAPTLRRYGQPLPMAFLLPVAGILYTLMTFDSARRHWLGRGGVWKGRIQAGAESR
ncbi:MAG: glycosyltransferase [Alphaproteobacteria bacterium]